MARRPRLHVPGGMYFIVLRGDGGEGLFNDEEELREFEEMVAEALHWARCSMHAFCWFGDTAMMAMQVSDVRSARFVQRITSRYAKYINSKRNRSGHLFAAHHRSVLVQRSRFLLPLIHYIHLAPVRAGIAESLDVYEWSSHRAYLCKRKISWLTRFVARGMLENAGIISACAYAEWMKTPGDQRLVSLITDGHRDDPRIVGSDGFVASVALHGQEPVERASIDEIVERIAFAQGVGMKYLLSSSRRRRHVLTRALITWEATRKGTATLAEVGKRLGRDPSTLLAAVKSYKRQFPGLFMDPEGLEPGVDDGPDA